MADEEDQKADLRFFAAEARNGDVSGSALSLTSIDLGPGASGAQSGEIGQGTCLTLRLIQRIIPSCVKKRTGAGPWEPDQGDVFKHHEVEETKYPFILKFLENKVLDVIFVLSSLASIFLFFFSVGFLIRSKILWGIIHCVNGIYTLGLFGQWLQILITSKFAKTNQGYTKWDVGFALATIFPLDLIVLVIYNINNVEIDSPQDQLIVIFSRINYLLRIYYISKYFNIWENQLIIGDFKMFLIRTILYAIFLTHIFGCLWHRIACKSFTLKHFKMTPDEATVDVCEDEHSWIRLLQATKKVPLLDHPQWNVLLTHYFLSIYWGVMMSCGLGFGDLQIHLSSDYEVIFTAVTQIAAWIFTLTIVSGTLTSLLVESDTERESYLTRRFAIRQYLEFVPVSKSISESVGDFYDYLWQRRKGIMELDLIDNMTPSLRAEVFYDVNKFVMDQLPLLENLDEAFLMNLSIYIKSTFHLAGEILFRKSEIGDRMYYVHKGYLEILSADDAHPIGCIRSGSIIGEMHIVHPYPHGATVRCGSECDLLVLTRKDFRAHMSRYPEYWKILLHRVDERFDRSEILLGLCEKHNRYQEAFARVDENLHTEAGDGTAFSKVGSLPKAVTNVKNMVPDRKEDTTHFKPNIDMDEISLNPEQIKKIMELEVKAQQKAIFDSKKRRRSLLEEAYAAVEVDVNRAGNLAKDLGMPKPPLFITVPHISNLGIRNTMILQAGSRIGILRNRVLQDSLNYCAFTFKLIQALIAMAVAWYYVFEISYRSKETVEFSYIWHVADVVFAIGFIYDMLQVVVTPKKTLENFKEILLYRAKTPIFYVRLFAFLPWEYLIAPLATCCIHCSNPGESLCFNCLKLNRCLELIVVFNFFRQIESIVRFSIVYVLIIKFGFLSLFGIHVMSVMYQLIRDRTKHWEINRNRILPNSYEIPLYWATQVFTATGFGDFLYTTDSEVFAYTFCVLTGVCILTYYGAKHAALLANAARRRVAFKQTYYSVQNFMTQRKFPKALADRVTKYYDLQWRAHEGVLIPSQQSVIWDAPESIINSVSFSQARKLISRCPLVKNGSEATLLKLSKTLKPFFVPPGETVLYPNDKRRELYIIARGYCEIFQNGRSLGTISDGRYFGLAGLIYGINRDFKIVTQTHCKFFCLLFEDFVELVRGNSILLRDYKILRGEIPFKSKKGNKSGASGPANSGLVQKFNELKSKKKSENVQGNIGDNGPTTIVVEKPLAVAKEGKLIDVKKPTPSKFRRFSLLLPKAISPTGNFIRIWTGVRTLVAIFMVIFVTAQASFALHPGITFLTTLCLDLYCLIDIYLNMNTGYLGPENLIVLDTSKTFRHYCNGPLIIDLLGVFPLDYFLIPFVWKEIKLFGAMPSKDFANNSLFRRIAALRLTRVTQVYRLFLTGNLIEKAIFQSLSFVTLIGVVPLMFLFLHFATCLVTISTCYWSLEVNPRCPETALVLHLKQLKLNNLGNLKDAIYVSLPAPENFDIFDPITMYVSTLYWVVQASLNVGFGDFVLYDEDNIDYHPRINRILAIVVIMTGVVVSVHLGSKVTACMVGEDSRRIALRERMKVVFNFLSQHQVSKSIQRRVREAFFNAWDKTKGISPNELFVALYPALKADVMTQLYEVQLRKSPLLADLDEPGIRLLSSKLTEVFYAEGEYLMHAGDLNDDVFIISTGVVAAYGITGGILTYMAPGSLLGEMSALFEVQRIITIVAAMDTETFVLRRSHFLEFLNLYPDIRQKLEEASLAHYQETMEFAMMHANVGVEVLLEPQDAVEAPTKRKDVRGAKTGTKAHKKKKKISALSIQSFTGSIGSRNSYNYLESTTSSTINLSRKEILEQNLHCVMDPLRVHVKGTATTSTPGNIVADGGSYDQLAVKDQGGSGLADYDDEKNNKWWSVFLSFGRIPRDEMGLIHLYKTKKLFDWIISPLCPLCSNPIFVCIHLLMACLSCSLASFQTAFRTGLETENESQILFAIALITELYFLFRFIGNFFMGYFDDYGQLITGHQEIMMRYVRRPGGLFLDVICLPFYLIIHPFIPNIGAKLKSMQLLRVFLFMRYLNETESELRMKASMIKIVKISIILCFIFHFCACLWYLIACNGSICDVGSWMDRAEARMRKDTPELFEKGEIVNIGTRYFLSIFYVSTAITFTGLNFVELASVQEMLLTIFFLFSTVFILGFLIGEITQCLASQVTSKIHYQHQLTVLQDYFISLGLKRSKLSTVQKYYKILWQKCKGIPFEELLQDLPYPLHADITHAVYGPSIKSSRILGRLDDTIIRQLSVRIVYEIYLPGTRIIRNGDVCDGMYFIKRGEVVVLDDNQNLELSIDILYENECFGEVKLLLPREQFRFSYHARLETEVGVLHRKDLEDVMSNYPIIQAEIIEKAKKVKQHRITNSSTKDQNNTSGSSTDANFGKI